MNEKFKKGLANQAFAELENIKTLREDFLACNADGEHISDLEKIMSLLYGMYLDLTRPVND